MYRIPKRRAVVLIASLAMGAACSAGPTEPELLQTGKVPSMDGIGWVGSGGRSDSTAESTATGIGWFGGGGRTDSTSLQTSETGIGVFGGGG